MTELFEYEKSIAIAWGVKLGGINYWVEKGLVPVATLKPFNHPDYANGIPESDIVTISFEDINLDHTSRKANNVLLLGGAGDGKSLLKKVIWFFLHNMGYQCIYVDPKSTDSGRAIRPWTREEGRLPPYTDAKGIPLYHYVPNFARKKEQSHLAHNFINYAVKLKNLDEREEWMTLGMTRIASSKAARIVREFNSRGENITLDKLEYEFKILDKEELTQPSVDSALRTIVELREFNVLSDKIPELDFNEAVLRNKSVCISYNSASPMFISFDIGKKIREVALEYFNNKKRVPVMWFFDDAGYYAKHLKNYSNFNYAVEQITKIGNDYRSLGLANCLSVQSLNIIDEEVAETYRYKFISPMFEGVESLSKLNIPRRAIDILRSDELVRDEEHNLLQWVFVDKNKNVVPCFPLNPPCNHFDTVYFERNEEGI